MNPSDVAYLSRDLLSTALLLSLPAVAVSLIVGLFVSVLQTITSVQEQTLSFAPRILAVGVTLMFSIPWILGVCTRFTMRMMVTLLEAAQ